LAVKKKIEMSCFLIFLLLTICQVEAIVICNDDLFESSSCRCANSEEIRCAFIDQDSCEKDQTFEDLSEITRITVEGDYCGGLISKLSNVAYEQIIFTTSPCPEIVNCRRVKVYIFGSEKFELSRSNLDSEKI